MEHPLIKDISDLSETQLSDKINELNNKYMIGSACGSGENGMIYNAYECGDR